MTLGLKLEGGTRHTRCAPPRCLPAQEPAVVWAASFTHRRLIVGISQFDTLPMVLSEEEMKPGDLVFISGTYFKEGVRVHHMPPCCVVMVPVSWAGGCASPCPLT